MLKLDQKKIAIVCDWIKDWWWAELVLEQLLGIFPQADIFTSIFFHKNNKIFKWKNIKTSFIQNIPILKKSHKISLFLRPLAFESFDLSNYDIIISSSSAESKWVITKPESIHICYCHTPTRYFWSHYHEYFNMMEFWYLNFLWRYFMPIIINKLRVWDFVASSRPDYYIANSVNTKNRIKKYYNRDSYVIYPCIDTEKFYISKTREDYFLYVWRCIPYKKFDLIIDAFNKNWKKIILLTNTKNKLYYSLLKKSNSNIIWKLNVSDEEKIDFFSKAKAFLFPPEEDFWLVTIEAMASWTPVIAYAKWWALETVIENKTWIFFYEQTVESLNKAIEKFEYINFNYKEIKEYSLKYNKKEFKKKLLSFVKNIIK